MTTSTTSAPTEVELAIGGMTCASCAARIEKKLNRLEGVSATVNYATEKARVSFSGGVSVPELIATVEATGYTAREPEPALAQSAGSGAAGGEAKPDGLAGLRQRLVTAVVLTVPVIAMAMVPALQF
ncbi:heavy metal-associated domain-containing protein, partial [Streptomyces sp. NPDC087512]|uniref:heavy metal-associated domain-containing protein n=1 Tax=Streptomyces sp. NPDC087512 TaxID=3155059 RepID=UPI0034440882